MIGESSAEQQSVRDAASSIVRKAPQNDPVTLNIVRARRYPWRWAGILLLTLAAAGLLLNVATNQNFHWSVAGRYLFHPQVLRGVGWTLLLTIMSMLLAVTLAIGLVFMRQSSNPIARRLAWLWIWFFRGTPVYTQLVFWGLLAALYPRVSIGLPFGPEIFDFATRDLVTPLAASVVGLGFNESAYLAEIFRAGFDAIDRGQTEAAQALGLKGMRIRYRIIMPQAMRIIIPPTGNETIGMLKTTSLVLAVPFTLDLTYSANAIANRLYMPVPLLLVSAFWYLAVTSVLMVGQTSLERHFGRGMSRLGTIGG